MGAFGGQVLRPWVFDREACALRWQLWTSERSGGVPGRDLTVMPGLLDV